MFVCVTEDRSKLMEEDNFKELYVVLDNDELPMNWKRASDAAAVWIPIKHLKEMPKVSSPEWQASFDTMIEKAQPFGWVSSDGLSVRAHIKLGI